MGTVDIDAIVARLHKLEEENSRLKTLLSKHGISYEKSKQEPTPVVSKSENKDSAMQRLSLQEKVKLFRSIFKGREDVFAKRWYSDVTKDLKSFDHCGCAGSSPAPGTQVGHFTRGVQLFLFTPL